MDWLMEKAKEFNKRVTANLQATRKLIRVDELLEDELLDIINLYGNYEVDKLYKINDIFKYEDKLYKVIQGHTSQKDWIPNENHALYLNLMPENVIPEWVQPTGQHDSYNIGDKVVFESQVYESVIANNTWSPMVYPQGWTLI